MKPIKFKEQTNIIAKNQKEYQPLPAMIRKDGAVISCWSLSFKERVKVLFTGKVWMALMMFGEPTTPSLLTVTKTDLIEIDKINKQINK